MGAFAAAREFRVSDMLRAVTEFAPAIGGLYDFTILRWQRKHLLTCDNPVVLVSEAAEGGVGLYTASTIFLPLSRQITLQVVHRARELHAEGATLPGTATLARVANQAVVCSASSRLNFNPDDRLEDLVGPTFPLPTPSPASFEAPRPSAPDEGRTYRRGGSLTVQGTRHRVSRSISIALNRWYHNLES